MRQFLVPQSPVSLWRLLEEKRLFTIHRKAMTNEEDKKKKREMLDAHTDNTLLIHFSLFLCQRISRLFDVFLPFTIFLHKLLSNPTKNGWELGVCRENDTAQCIYIYFITCTMRDG